MSNDMTNERQKLFELLVKIDNVEDMADFLDDLCTYNEIDSMAQRLSAAELLFANNTYDEIIKKTDISSATLSRVSRCVKHGKGYKKFIAKSDEAEKKN